MILGWVALASACLCWPAGSRAPRLRALVDAGRLVSPVASRRHARTAESAPAWIERLAGAAGRVSGLLSGLLVVGTMLCLAVPVLAAVEFGFAAGCVAGCVTAEVVSARRGRAEGRRRIELDLAVSLLCAELDAGSSAPAALEAARAASPTYAAGFDRIRAGIDSAGSPSAPLSGPMPPLDVGAELRPIAAAWRLAGSAGLPPAEALRRIRADLASRRDADRQVAAAVAGPRSSGTLLAILPLLGLGLGTVMGARPVAVLFATAGGRLLLCAGTLLEVAGVWWTRRLIASVRAP